MSLYRELGEGAADCQPPRRPALFGWVKATAAAPALAAALAANTKGNSRRASLHAGIALLATSTAV